MIRNGIRRLFRMGLHRDVDAARDVADEISMHLEMRTEQLVAQGWTPEKAKAEAHRRFAASPDALRALGGAASRRENRFRWSDRREAFLQDLRYVFRGLARSRGFTFTVVATLSLGLGANAALFSVLDRMFLQTPAGVREPENVRRLYRRSINTEKHTVTYLTVYSYPMIRAIVSALPDGARLAGYRADTRVPFGANDSAEPGVLTYVIGDYFGLLGVGMAHGRPFSADEYRPEGLSPVIVLSYARATRQFGSASAAVGKEIEVVQHRYMVVGVTAPGFAGTDLNASDAWAPLNSRGSWKIPDQSWIEGRGTLFISTLVRAPGDGAFARVATAAAGALLADPTLRMRDSSATMIHGSLREALSPGYFLAEQQIATRLAAVAALILIIACANVANMLLARAITRRREIAIRLALGVSRARLVRQLLTESVVLAMLSCVGAVFVGGLAATALRSLLLPSVSWGEPAVGWRVVLFAVGSAVVAGFAAGVIPAMQASRPQLAATLRGGARQGTQQHSRIRSGLLVAQVALSLTLLAGAGLFLRSLREVQAIDIGYDSNQIIFASFRVPRDAGVSYAQISDRLMDAVPRIEQLPTVESVAYTQNIPMNAFSFIDNFLPGRDSTPLLGGRGPIVSFVSPRFFATMGMRVLDGRDFETSDRIGSEPVLIVNTAMAETYWPGENAIGKCLILHKRGGACRRIVGTVSSAHYGSVIEKLSMQFFVPLLQESDDGKAPVTGALEVRAKPGTMAVTLDGVKRELARVTMTGTTPLLRTFTDQLEPQFRTWRLGALLFSLAAGLALLVALVGIYGNISYALSQRTHEMGVRIALGASAGNIVRMVTRESMRVVLVGVACGAGLTIASGRAIQAMLYGVSPYDPLVLAGVAITLIVAGIAASLGPAVRATRVNPLDSLRAE